MTEEKVKQSQELLKKLNWLKEQKEKWEASQKIRSLELCNMNDLGLINRVMEVADTFINFDDLKILTLAKIDKRIEEVQKQFDNL